MTKQLTKLTLTNFNPKVFFAQPEGTNEFLLGRLVGSGNGVKNAVAQDGVTPMYGMKGDFGMEFTDANREDERSGVLFLPEAFMSPMLDQLEDTTDEATGEVIKGAKSIDFAFDVFVIKAANPAGYSWSLRPLLETSASDPLAAVKLRIAAPLAKLAIAAPVTAGAKK